MRSLFSAFEGFESIAGPFDIQYRNWAEQNQAGVNYASGRFLSVDTLILREEPVAVDGLIVDIPAGGVGFRRHTVPQGSENGASWSENLLWISPETICVDSNITFHFTPRNKTDRSSNLYSETFIRDEGGFTNLPDSPVDFNNGDYFGDPNLWSRAFNAAWYVNDLLMAALGLVAGDSTPSGFQPDSPEDYEIKVANGKGGSTQDWGPSPERIVISDMRGDFHRDLPSEMMQTLG